MYKIAENKLLEYYDSNSPNVFNIRLNLLDTLQLNATTYRNQLFPRFNMQYPFQTFKFLFSLVNLAMMTFRNLIISST